MLLFLEQTVIPRLVLWRLCQRNQLRRIQRLPFANNMEANLTTTMIVIRNH